ncbi:MAG TPA: hypothetical protein VK658_02110 [Chryseolinea sp.]|nr:hypothetical protein [Chryseolinea sp.]
MPLKTICLFILLLEGALISRAQDIIQHGPDEVYHATKVIEGRTADFS